MDNTAIIILSPSNSIGKVRIITPVEIASKRFLNLVSPLFIIPKILVNEREIVVTDQITSTQEIAIAIGKPNSYRTVANACGKNPLPIIRPCHRVICSDGKIGGYSAEGGTVLKRALLRCESF